MKQLLATLTVIGVLLTAGQVLAGPVTSGQAPSGALPQAARSVPGILAQDNWHQVRIEQHFSIRITPGAPTVSPNMLEELEQDDERSPRMDERNIGKCVSINGLVGEQSAVGNRLLLFMRDHSVVAAQLDKRCQSRDFYSGFYVERPSDGRLCVNRDKLQARSGANCKIHKLQTLVMGSRRFP